MIATRSRFRNGLKTCSAALPGSFSTQSVCLPVIHCINFAFSVALLGRWTVGTDHRHAHLSPMPMQAFVDGTSRVFFCETTYSHYSVLSPLAFKVPSLTDIGFLRADPNLIFLQIPIKRTCVLGAQDTNPFGMDAPQYHDIGHYPHQSAIIHGSSD